jgi:hypothetical protein
MAKPVNAQTVPKPSVPEFSVRFVNDSYSKINTNPYTGQSETQQINNNFIELTIKNQPYVYSNNGLSEHTYLDIRIKPHFASSDNWTELYPLENLYNSSTAHSYSKYISSFSPSQISSSYTTDFSVVPTQVYQGSGYDVQGTPFYEIPIGSQIDFQVEALAGHNSTYWQLNFAGFQYVGGSYASAIAYDTASGWSPTQTVTIGSSITSSSSSSAPTSTASIPELSWLVIGPLLLSVFSVAVIVRRRKNR